jgi:hypothetical protein
MGRYAKSVIDINNNKIIALFISIYRQRIGKITLILLKGLYFIVFKTNLDLDVGHGFGYSLPISVFKI